MQPHSAHTHGAGHTLKNVHTTNHQSPITAWASQMDETKRNDADLDTSCQMHTDAAKNGGGCFNRAVIGLVWFGWLFF